jgi:DNA-3-methyladenine glycosylase II
MSRSVVEPVGDFDLAQSVRFLEDWPVTRRPAGGSVLRFSFCVEHDWRPVGVRVAQSDRLVEIAATEALEGIPEQVSRILSLDVDGTAVSDIAQRDPVVARLVRSAPGLRPVCFWTPWEAACWAVLSQRTSMRTASVLKQRISAEYGTPVVMDGVEMATFPAPQVLLDVDALRGVGSVKVDRLRALAAAALDGTLTAEALRSVPADRALEALRRLPGVGPFSAALILIRGAGAPDVFTTSEPRLLTAVRDAYGTSDFPAVADGWRPLRSLVSFWLRSLS